MTILLISVLITACALFIVVDKPNINTATYEQLTDIRGIGHITANGIISYLKFNPEANIDDLDVVPYVGEYKLELIKEVYD